MSLKIPIETSARHIHLSQEDFKKLFGADAEMHYTKELSQPGQYACEERLTVTGPKGSFERVIVLGPCRSAGRNLCDRCPKAGSSRCDKTIRGYSRNSRVYSYRTMRSDRIEGRRYRCKETYSYDA